MRFYPFVQHDGGRATSRRPRQRNDCTVRALALVTDTPYDVVYDRLAQDGRTCGRGFNLRRWIACQMNPAIGEPELVFGCRLEWTAYPAVKGQIRMGPAKFCRQHPNGRYVIKTAGHVCAVIDGAVYDLAPERPDRCIYGAWRVEGEG